MPEPFSGNKRKVGNPVSNLVTYFSLLKPVKWQFTGALACGLIYAATSGFGLPFILDRILPQLYGQNELTPAQLFMAVAQIPLIFAFRAAGGFSNQYLVEYCGTRLLAQLRQQVFDKLQVLHLAFFAKRDSGDLLSRIMNDTDIVQKAVMKVANDLIVQPVILISALGFVTWMAFNREGIGLILLFLLMVPACVFPIRIMARKLHQRARQMQKQMGAVTECVRENLGATREIRAFNLEARESSRFKHFLNEFLRFHLKVEKYLKAISPSIEFISSVGIALAIFYGRLAGITFLDIGPLIVALYFAYDPIKKLGVVNGEIRKGLASIERVEEILKEPILIVDRPDAQAVTEARGNLEFIDVSFSYGDGPVLKEINCTLAENCVYALVGPSGAGKSTFASLLPRFHEPTSGRVALDGLDIRDIKISDLRRQIAFVPQDPVLFDDTIVENILVSRPDATHQEAEEAARRAFAHPFIVAFEAGYATVVGDRGARLSGGQLQRIALARAFLKNAPILILDEATSALDSESEEVIQKALDYLVKDKTVLIIAHRFSTIHMAGRILVFQNGRIVAMGSHDELLDSCDVYTQLYRRQMLP